MFTIAVLISISIVNLVFLTLTIWARLQLNHTDWWAVFLAIFLIGFVYQLEYSELTHLQQSLSSADDLQVRRNIFCASPPENSHLEHELEVLSRPTAAHTRAERGARGPITIIHHIDASSPRRTVSTTL